MQRLVHCGRCHHIHAATFLVEEHATVHKGEQCVIPAATDTEAWMHLRSALADDDVASNHGLAAELLNAEALAARLATVLDGTLSFFMGHGSG